MNYLPRRNRRKLLKSNGNQFDTVKFMKRIILECAYGDSFINNLVNNLQLSRDLNGMAKAANFFYTNTQFDPDSPDLQTIRTPRRSLIDQKANCVDYSTAMGAVGVALNLPTALVMCSTDPNDPKNYNHIFALVNGVPFDLVINQDHVNAKYKTPKSVKQMNFKQILGKNAPYFQKRIYPVNYT
jgi:hypothetical protein